MLEEQGVLKGTLWESPLELHQDDFTANILCQHHNSALSPLDTAGKGFIETLKRCEELRQVRIATAKAERINGGAKRLRKWKKQSFSINRLKFERLLLKATINWAVVGEQRLGASATGHEPTRELVEYVFGRDEKPPELVITWTARVGAARGTERSHALVFIDTWTDSAPSDVSVAASIYSIARYPFVVSFVGTQLPARIIANALSEPSAQLMRLGGVNFDIAGRRSHKIVFTPAAEPLPRFPAREHKDRSR